MLRTDVTAQQLSPDELQAVIDKACRSKRRYGRETARKAAAAASTRTRSKVNPYRCPFSDGTKADSHWHIGHPPSLASLQQLAAAIRTGRTPL